MGTPTLIVVTGPAGSGKTTLAHALAAAIGCPALCRDEIKEGMVASHPGFVAATSDPLTMRTYALFFELIGVFLREEVTLVAEAAFQHRLWWQGLDPLTGSATLRVVRCRVPETTARDRVLTRMTAQANRAAHADTAHLQAAAPFEHLHADAEHLGVALLDVDTADGWRPDLDEIVAFCRT